MGTNGDLDLYTTDQLLTMHTAASERASALYNDSTRLIGLAAAMGDGRFAVPAYQSLMGAADLKKSAADEQHALMTAVGAEYGRRVAEKLTASA
jgi:hypothetical protein